MKAVICGAGTVGYSIAKYLSEENHQVSVIDTDEKKLKDIENSLDVKTVIGSASNPDILLSAGMNEADLMIAVTSSDEVNMVSCSLSYLMYRTPVKIARVRSGYFSSADKKKILSDMHIDAIVSPEEEMAKNIARNLNLSGAIEYIYLVDKNLAFLGSKCLEGSVFIGKKVSYIEKKLKSFGFNFVAVCHEGKKVPDVSTYKISVDDDVYFIIPVSSAKDVLASFGNDVTKTRKILICGGGRVGFNLARFLEEEGVSDNLTLVEENPARAMQLARSLDKTLVVCGNAVDEQILKEISLKKSDAVVSLTGEDEDNILLSVLAKQNKVKRTFALVNNPVYNKLVSDLGVDVILNPNLVTIATVLRYLRKGMVDAIYSLKPEMGELMVVEALETSKIINVEFGKIKQPKGVKICAVVRNGELMPLSVDFKIKPKDKVVVLSEAQHFSSVEKMFAAGLMFF